MGHYMMAICMTTKIISIVFYGFSWLASSRSAIKDDLSLDAGKEDSSREG